MLKLGGLFFLRGTLGDYLEPAVYPETHCITKGLFLPKNKNKKTKGLIEKIMNKAHYWAHIYTYDGSKNGLRPETSIVGNLALTSMKHLRLRLGDCGINSSCGSSISDSDDGNTNIHSVKGSTSFGASRERLCCLFCVLCPCVTFAACGVLCLKRAECDSLIIKGGDGE